MASSTNPRVRRFNQMMRVRNTEQIPQDAYYGKPTITGGFGGAINTFHPIFQNTTSKALLEWDYNQYHDRYAHLYPEDNSGLNNYKITEQNISHNYDKVDKSFKDKKLQSTVKKNIILQGNKPQSWMRKQVHGDPNSYSSFKDIVEHRYLYNVNDPWPEGEVGYGPFNRPPSGGGGSGAVRSQSVDYQMIKNSGNKGKGPRKNNFTNDDNNSNLSIASNASNNSRNSRPNSVRSSANKNQQNSMINNNSKIYFRNNPAHVDEGFMPSYGINHNNIELDEQNVPDDQYNMEKIVQSRAKAAHLDEDFLPSYNKKYINGLNTMEINQSMVDDTRNTRSNKKKVNSSSTDFGNQRKPQGYMLKESQRLAAQQDMARRSENGYGRADKKRFGFNWKPGKTENYTKDNFYVPEPTIEDYHHKMMAGENLPQNGVGIKNREMAHANHETGNMRSRYIEEKMKDTFEDKNNNWVDPVIYKKRYNGYNAYTGYVDPGDAKFYRKRNYK